MLNSLTASEAAHQYLQSLPKNSQKKGQALYAAGKVRKIHAEDDYYEANVLDGSAMGQVVSLVLDEDEWFGDCTCSMEGDCKHCFAAMRAIMEEAGAPEVQARKKQKKAPAAAVKAPSSKKPLSQDAEFVAEVAAKAGRKLERKEKLYLERIYQLWLNHRDSTQISSYTLTPLLEKQLGWSYDMYQLWDAPPKTPWEAWLCLADFIHKKGQAWPKFLVEITPQEEIDRHLALWHRRQAEEHWRNVLMRYGYAPSNQPGSVELRAAFEADGLQLESRDVLKGDRPFIPLGKTAYHQLDGAIATCRVVLDPLSRIVWEAFRLSTYHAPKLPYNASGGTFGVLLRNPLVMQRLLNAERQPLRKAPETLVWQVQEPDSDQGDYGFQLTLPNGEPPPAALAVVDGLPGFYLTKDGTIFETPPMGVLASAEPVQIPVAALESPEGVSMLDSLNVPLPKRLVAKTREVEAQVIITCELVNDMYRKSERLMIQVNADLGPDMPKEQFTGNGWQRDSRAKVRTQSKIMRIRRAAMSQAGAVLNGLGVRWEWDSSSWSRSLGTTFPAEFAEWLMSLPPEFELHLDPTLATLRDNPVAGTVQLDAAEAGVDWFDLQVSLKVSDTELTQEEIDLLLSANGGFVRLGQKGWRRLALQLSPEEEKYLAEAGLDARDFTGEKHRVHALQLAGKSAERLLPARQAEAVRRRAEEIQTRIAPDVPTVISAELRPYQIEGYHFLAYLSTNHFGGILADDMGLGKTLQTLTWLAWLREQPDTPKLPSLVVCPKSVVSNWQIEAERFLPGYRVALLGKGACDAEALRKAREEADLVVINYVHLRLLETELLAGGWLAAILDEAQFIKNPSSQTTRVAVQLQAQHRLALTGTPIENRLLDLWSIMSFAMPGVLGARARFNKSFDQRKDPFARVRLAARVRPFVLRRKKSEVARDLPERSEEDLLCEMEGEQAKLYGAELKRARQVLLKLKTSKDLDKARFNILTSLLRLRQICCHPALVRAQSAKDESAKLTALMDLLEPLMQEGHKVLIFSQFTQMLDLIQTAVQEREWATYLLTGETEDRQSLVNGFQTTAGAAVFLISLRAGGFGLNLTAASYVVLFDPWWNPAVENQAIDRTHRIGQTNKVNAYRLIVKDSIEEKIRRLQTQKSALAADVLGEEAFSRTLTLDDFKFLLTGE